MDVRWDPPGPGQWACDRSHMPAGCTPIMQHISTTAIVAGMRRVFAELGTPLETLDARYVNGQFYSRLRPLIRPDRPSATLPPLPVLKLLTRLHPEMRRRNATAARVMVEQPWMRVIDDWRDGGKAAIVEANLALGGVELAELDDAAVLAHAARCLDHCLRTWEHHFWLHGYDLGPLGQYLHQAIGWGIDPSEALSLLEGASPSTTEPMIALAQIRSLVEASGRVPRTLDELRSISPEIDERVGDYLRLRGTVLFSRYDLDGITLGERPDLVLASIMNADVHDATVGVAERTRQVRAKVPAEHTAAFDEVLAQARAAMDLRDDNGPTTAEWPAGLMRLALLELGRRLVASGALARPELAFELHPSELAPALLAGAPTGAELERRALERAAQKLLDAPPLIGPPEAVPPPEVLPANLARTTGMVMTVMRFMGMDGTSSGGSLDGSGIGTHTVRGIARVATSPEEALDVLEPGDVLVVAGTTPAYNLVLSIAGGIVTADGGPMSHAAVIARELGIPAVVGARGALTEIADGSLVEIDPVAGSVRVVAPPGV